jgi:hypothetical protein
MPLSGTNSGTPCNCCGGSTTGAANSGTPCGCCGGSTTGASHSGQPCPCIGRTCCTPKTFQNTSYQMTVNGCGDNVVVSLTFGGFMGSNCDPFWQGSWSSACGHTIFAEFTCTTCSVCGPSICYASDDCVCFQLGLSCDDILFTLCSNLNLTCVCTPFSFSIPSCGGVSGCVAPCNACFWSFSIVPTP